MVSKVLMDSYERHALGTAKMRRCAVRAATRAVIQPRRSNEENMGWNETQKTSSEETEMRTNTFHHDKSQKKL